MREKITHMFKSGNYYTILHFEMFTNCVLLNDVKQPL